MRVALVLSNPLPPREGVGTYAARLAKRLHLDGHEVTLFTRRGRGEPARGWLGNGAVDGLPVVRPWFLPLHPLHVHLHAPAMRQALREEGPFDVVHLHTPLPPPVRATGAANVLTVHTPMADDVRTLRWGEPRALVARLQLPVSMAIERRLLREAQAVTAVSPSVAAALELRYGVAPGQVQVVPNGVEAEAIRPRFDGRDERRLLYVGRLAARKGLPDLLEAMRGLDGFHLDIVGDGPLRGWLRKQASHPTLTGRVTVHGFVAREVLDAMWQSAGLFVHVPAYEGMPTSLLEAMAAGLPVVTTDAPGTRDIVVDGTTGRLVPLAGGRADVVDLRQAIRGLADDARERRRLAVAARRQVEDHHDWPRLARRMVEVYAGAVAAAAEGPR